LPNAKESDMFSNLQICFSDGFSSKEITNITEAFGKIVPAKRVYYAKASHPVTDSLSLIVNYPVIIFIIGFARALTSS
jgi:hypothetical protein